MELHKNNMVAKMTEINYIKLLIGQNGGKET